MSLPTSVKDFISFMALTCVIGAILFFIFHMAGLLPLSYTPVEEIKEIISPTPIPIPSKYLIHLETETLDLGLNKNIIAAMTMEEAQNAAIMLALMVAFSNNQITHGHEDALLEALALKLIPKEKL